MNKIPPLNYQRAAQLLVEAAQARATGRQGPQGASSPRLAAGPAPASVGPGRLTAGSPPGNDHNGRGAAQPPPPRAQPPALRATSGDPHRGLVTSEAEQGSEGTEFKARCGCWPAARSPPPASVSPSLAAGVGGIPARAQPGCRGTLRAGATPPRSAAPLTAPSSRAARGAGRAPAASGGGTCPTSGRRRCP